MVGVELLNLAVREKQHGIEHAQEHIYCNRHLLVALFEMEPIMDKTPQIDSASEKRLSSTTPEMRSCRKKKSEDASFVADLMDHIDEFVHASMDEHKTCFEKTIKKMFGMSKIVAEKNASTETVESVLPLRTTTS